MSPEDTATESCKCNGVCSRKDGSKAKGCPCKTCGVFCTERCKCLATGKNCQNQVGFLLSFSLTSYFSCFCCIPNNSTQLNDHSNVFQAISFNRIDINDFLLVEGYCFDSVIFTYSPRHDPFCFISQPNFPHIVDPPEKPNPTSCSVSDRSIEFVDLQSLKRSSTRSVTTSLS